MWSLLPSLASGPYALGHRPHPILQQVSNGLPRFVRPGCTCLKTRSGSSCEGPAFHMQTCKVEPRRGPNEHLHGPCSGTLSMHPLASDVW